MEDLDGFCYFLLALNASKKTRVEAEADVGAQRDSKVNESMCVRAFYVENCRSATNCSCLHKLT